MGQRKCCIEGESVLALDIVIRYERAEIQAKAYFSSKNASWWPDSFHCLSDEGRKKSSYFLLSLSLPSQGVKKSPVSSVSSFCPHSAQWDEERKAGLLSKQSSSRLEQKPLKQEVETLSFWQCFSKSLFCPGGRFPWHACRLQVHWGSACSPSKLVKTIL